MGAAAVDEMPEPHGFDRSRLGTVEVASVPSDGADWRSLAVCRGRGELFFGKVAERPEARQRREDKARRLCDVCVVRQTCRQYARDHREYGFWGGENEMERHMAGYLLTAPIGVKAKLSRTEPGES